MDFECRTCGTRMQGTTIADGRMSSGFTATKPGGPPPGCPNPACVHYGRAKQAGWAVRFDA